MAVKSVPDLLCRLAEEIDNVFDGVSTPQVSRTISSLSGKYIYGSIAVDRYNRAEEIYPNLYVPWMEKKQKKQKGGK